MTVSHQKLLLLVGSFPATLPRTEALERAIRIGAGYHDKWYASQGEHWRGWMGYKDALLRRQHKDPDMVSAIVRWRLNCAPMMFWLAEAAGVSPELLDRAEEAAKAAAARIDHDHPSHGKAMREVLPWWCVEEALAALPPLSPVASARAQEAVRRAHQKLVDLRGRKYA